jgi:hypothetical protein
MHSLQKRVSLRSFLLTPGPSKGGNYGPYVQSERLPLYHKHAHDLIEVSLLLPFSSVDRLTCDLLTKAPTTDDPSVMVAERRSLSMLLHRRTPGPTEAQLQHQRYAQSAACICDSLCRI